MSDKNATLLATRYPRAPQITQKVKDNALIYNATPSFFLNPMYFWIWNNKVSLTSKPYTKYAVYTSLFQLSRKPIQIIFYWPQTIFSKMLCYYAEKRRILYFSTTIF